MSAIPDRTTRKVIVRRSQRFRLRVPLKVTIESPEGAQSGELVELSAYGAFVRMPVELVGRERVTMLVDLAGLTENERRLTATPVWGNRLPAKAAPGMPEGCGLEFVRERQVLTNALGLIRALRALGCFQAPATPVTPDSKPAIC